MTVAEPPSARSRRRTTLLFFAAVVLHALAYFLLSPPWMGEDEPWHFEYVEHVAHGHQPWGGTPMAQQAPAGTDPRRLHATAHLQVRQRFADIPIEEVDATERAILASMRAHDFWRRVDWAGSETDVDTFDQVAKNFSAMKNPPGYYLLAGAWLRLWSPESIEARLTCVRALSFLLYLATVAFGLAFLRTVIADERLALLGAALIAWFPMHARQASLVSNDVLANTAIAAVFWLCGRWLAGRSGKLDALWLLVACAVGLFTKTTSASAVVVIGFAVALRARPRGSAALRTRWLPLGAVGLLAAIAFAVWIRKSPALPRSLGRLQLRLEQGLSLDMLAETWRTWIGAFNWYSRELPDGVYAAAAVVAALALLGASRALYKPPAEIARSVLTLCVASVVFQYAAIVLNGVGAGRYFMPMLPAVALLAVAGLVAVWPRERHVRAALACIVLLFVLDAIFLWYGLVPNQYLLWNA
ncbi:MAG: DUF2142 domain-containing protein [Planctomycetota bacterium]